MLFFLCEALQKTPKLASGSSGSVSDPGLSVSQAVSVVLHSCRCSHKPAVLTDLCFSPSVLEGSYLRVQIYPLIPTKTSTLSQNQFHLPGIEWPHQASSSSSSSSSSRRHRRHRPHSRSPGRKWAAPRWTVWAALAAPTTAVTGRIHGATSTLPLCSADPQTLRTEKALP